MSRVELETQFIEMWAPYNMAGPMNDRGFDEDLSELLKEHAIGFGIWIKENQGKENFDFNRGDTDGWYNKWITNK